MDKCNGTEQPTVTGGEVFVNVCLFAHMFVCV